MDEDFNSSSCNATCINDSERNFVALLLLVIPVLTLFGNGLVVVSICRERSLHSTTNYLILSLAVADFLVALFVMPFAVYAEVDTVWNLPKTFCNVFIAGDVLASTASILNLVAVSWDRYMAVSSPIQYAQNSKKRIRVKVTIFVVWFISLVTALPLVSGLNDLTNTDHCEFTDALYICISSLVSFYAPCLIIIVLYTIVLKKLRRPLRSSKSRTYQRTLTQLVAAEGYTTEDQSQYEVSRVDGNRVSHYDSGIETKNEIITSFNMNSYKVRNGRACNSNCQQENGAPRFNGIIHQQLYTSGLNLVSPASPVFQPQSPHHLLIVSSYREAKTPLSSTPDEQLSISEPSDFVPWIKRRGRHPSLYSNCQPCSSNVIHCLCKNGEQCCKNGQPTKSVLVPRRRESKRTRKERKATQTLAVVLGGFLICWLPFFICHLTNSICKFRTHVDCIPGLAMFITTWLGYINSFLNPIIYTVFNPTYRNAFRKIFRRNRRRFEL